MTQRVEPGPVKAELHYRSAQQYHELARIVSNAPDSPVERNILVASSGALLYEAAKQCLNAVANLRGRDPKGNQEKLSEINSIAADWYTRSDLVVGARSAWYLHIHADQFNLPPEEFSRNFATATDFIGEMMAIYQSIRRDQQA